MAKRLAREKERYLIARRALNPRTTQAESSQEPLSLDTDAILKAPRILLDKEGVLKQVKEITATSVHKAYQLLCEKIRPKMCYGATCERLLYGYD